MNGAALPNMVAAAYASSGTLAATGTTDVNGHYGLNVPAGRYRVLAYDPNGAYATQFNGDAPSFEESAETDVTVQPAVVNFQLHPGGKVTGVVNTSGGIGAALTVAAYNLSGTRRGFTKTDDTGAYSIVLPPGSYKMAAYDEKSLFAPSFFPDKATFADGNPVTVNESQTTGSINFFLPLGARLSGDVTNTSFAPIPNAVVVAYNAAGEQITFAITAIDGTFNMTVPPGTYRLVAYDAAYVYAAGFLGGANSFETSPPIPLNGGSVRTDLRFRLEPGGLVSGTVTDEAGAGIRNISVAAYNNDGTQRTFVTTDANGKFVLLLPSGTFRIAAFDSALVFATRFYAQSTTFAHATVISAIPGQTVPLQPIALSHGGWFTGTVNDKLNGAPIPGVVVAAYDNEGNLIATGTATLPLGRYRLIVPAGTYRLIAYDPQLHYAPAFAGGVVSFNAIPPVSIAGGQETPISFALQRGTLVSGSVVDRLHAPVFDVRVIALDLEENAVAEAISGVDGSFRLALVAGKYKFLMVDPNGRYRTSFLGGDTFADATTITVDAAGNKPIPITVLPAIKRRAVRG